MKKQNNLKKKALVLGVSAAMTAGALPMSAFAVTGNQIAKDDTYEASVNITSPDEEEWASYRASVRLTVKNGVFDTITVTPEGDYEASISQIRNATNANSSKKKGLVTKLTGKAASADTIETEFQAVSGATITSNALKTAALEALSGAEEAQSAEAPAETPAAEALSAQEAQDAPKTEEPAASTTAEVPKDDAVYVLMNIPYDEFYAAELNNSVKVDAFSSATLNKPRTGSLAGGSYHVSAEGRDITGVIYPVKVAAGVDLSKYTQVTDDNAVEITVTNRGQKSTTTYAGKDALFENASYAYYVLKEAPAYYKELTVSNGTLSFGAVQGKVTTASGIGATISTNSQYGDYQLTFTDGTLPFDADTVKVSGIKLETTDGTSYGLRHLENIWLRTELAWSTGFTENVHGCPTSSAHYASMMGKTLSKVTYYTTDGVYELDITDTYVPIKFEGSVTAADAAIDAGETALTAQNLPKDFKAEYSVNGLTTSVKDGKLTYQNAKPGVYTLVVSDAGQKYAPLRSTFTLSTAKAQASYDEAQKKLIAAEGVTEDAFQQYLNQITTVSVNGQDYAASGRGSVAIINKKTGELDLSAKAFTADVTDYEIVVSSSGYPALSFKVSTKAPSKEEPTKPLPEESKTQAMYRLYNPNTGEHLYTADAAEKDKLDGIGWNYEGIGWYAPKESNIPVYRLFNPNADDHHYTINEAEKNYLTKIGWVDEGVAWYSADAKGGTPVLRQYNPNARSGSHNFTTSKAENDYLAKVGWKAEGTGWYAAAEQK